MEQLILTASQTVGPFFAPCLLREGALRQVLVQAQTEGQPIRLEGRVLDGDGLEVPDALVEIWQADAEGHYRHASDKQPGGGGDLNFSGYGRSDTAGGSYWFETIKPGRVPFGDGRSQAPHIAVTILARGLLNHLLTRLYFEDEAAANTEDPILQAVPEERRTTLLARLHQGAGSAPPVYRLDFVLQGEGETAFFQL